MLRRSVPNRLQQHLPLAVLKHSKWATIEFANSSVATALTACGIETNTSYFELSQDNRLQQHLPLAVLKHAPERTIFLRTVLVATALTACGIETNEYVPNSNIRKSIVATALTACGIETYKHKKGKRI